jgi:hypothetical protein
MVMNSQGDVADDRVHGQVCRVITLLVPKRGASLLLLIYLARDVLLDPSTISTYSAPKTSDNLI